MKKHTRATPAGVVRSRATLTRRTRRLCAKAEALHKARFYSIPLPEMLMKSCALLRPVSFGAQGRSKPGEGENA